MNAAPVFLCVPIACEPGTRIVRHSDGATGTLLAHNGSVITVSIDGLGGMIARAFHDTWRI